MDVLASRGSTASAPRLSSSSRRRSVGDLKQETVIDDDDSTSSTESSSKGTNPELWLTDEIEAVGELKRGAIAARFPEEFSVDSDFLNGASNVWLPARLHPEIAPGEFQDWLKKHGSQLSKMEDSVNRRKSILSYSYKTGDMPPAAVEAVPRGMFGGEMAAVRRRNTTGLVRRKSFVERADEEADGDAPFLVQTTQRSSLKRSKLANKRRDSTAGAPVQGARRRRGLNHDLSVPSVSSPLAPDSETSDVDSAVQYHHHQKQQQQQQQQQSTGVAKNSHHHRSTATAPAQPQSGTGHSGGGASAVSSAVPQKASASEKRMSTAEILKQVTAAVDDFGFDEFDLDLPAYDANAAAGSRNGKKLKRPPGPLPASKAPTAPLPQKPPQQLAPQQHQHQHQQTASGELEPATERKSVVHKKSGGSWWQWGRDDAQAAAAAQQQTVAEADRDLRSSSSPSATGGPSAVIAKPKSATETHTASQPAPAQLQHAQTAPLMGSEPPSASIKGKLPSPIAFLRFNRKSKKDRRGNEEPVSSPVPPSPTPVAAQQQPVAQQPVAVHRNDDVSDASSDTDASSATGGSQQRAKQAGGSQQQQQHSHIPSIITPVRPPPTTRLGVGSTRLPIHIERAIYRLASIKLANPRRPLLQQVLLSNMMFWYLELINPRSQQAQLAAAAAASAQEHQAPATPKSPAKQPPKSGSPPQQQRQQQQQQQQQQKQSGGGSSERRGKRGAPAPSKPHDSAGGRRRSGGGGGGSERVVMRSPQYERQQQQIYSNGQPSLAQQHPHQSSAGPHSDEDDDVPLALYRGERNAMSIG
ncbi:hypothetical protein IWW37_000328 [Coemansia sp. RSA 2050]|nr:hypothetical protein IWW37_000328 [Coemansia sp. RSA 2050]